MLPELLSIRASLSVALQVEQKIMKESEQQRADVTYTPEHESQLECDAARRAEDCE